MSERNVVHFMFVSDKDMRRLSIAKNVDSFRIQECWLGTLDAARYFTSEPKMLYDPTKHPWFVLNVRWTASGYEDIDRFEKIATNSVEWTYVKQSLNYTRIPFTDSVKEKVAKYIEKFWRKL